MANWGRLDAVEGDLEEIVEELEYTADRNGLEYADTFRATPIEKGIDEHIAKQSCCGVWEGKHTCRSGRTYYIGLNYGH